jgi:putative hemolysin
MLAVQMAKGASLIRAVRALLVIASCTPAEPGAVKAPESKPEPIINVPQAPSNVQLGNPAADACVNRGGTLLHVKSTDGENAICSFADGSRCEVWRLRRSECDPGACKAEDGICESGNP